MNLVRRDVDVTKENGLSGFCFTAPTIFSEATNIPTLNLSKLLISGRGAVGNRWKTLLKSLKFKSLRGALPCHFSGTQNTF